MTPRSARRALLTLRRQPLPAGIACSLRFERADGRIWATFTSTFRGAAHYPIDAACTADAQTVLDAAAWDYAADLEPEPTPAWLVDAIGSIWWLAHRVDHTGRCAVGMGVGGFAAQLLFAIEADEFPVPMVTDTSEGAIELRWTERDEAGRVLNLTVTVVRPHRILIRKHADQDPICCAPTGKYCQPQFLDAIQWLRPSVVGPLDESVFYVRGSRAVDCGADEENRWQC